MTHTKEHYEKIIAEARAGLAALEAKRWPKDGDWYYYVDSSGQVVPCDWRNNKYDLRLQSQGNVFRTKEAAQARSKWNRLHAAMMQAADGWVVGKIRHTPVWRAEEKRYAPLSCQWYYYANKPYFKTTEACDAAVKAILGDDAEFYLKYDGDYK